MQPEHLAEHLARPDRCPYCGSDQIEGQPVTIEPLTARQTMRCLQCSASWQDHYRLEGIIDQQGEHYDRTDLDLSDSLVMEDRDQRQRDIVPPDHLAACRATVIGVGAIGRQVALQLTAMGIRWLQLVDHDRVEAVNLAPQGFNRDDLGRPKVDAAGESCHQINPMLELYARPQRFRKSLLTTSAREEGFGNVVFACVDSIDTRRLIWQAIRDQVRFFVDGRMSGEVIRILTAADEASRHHYPTTLFSADQAYQGACTARSTIFTANIAAGLMLEQFSRYLRGLPVDRDLQLNLLSSEMSVHSPS